MGIIKERVMTTGVFFCLLLLRCVTLQMNRGKSMLPDLDKNGAPLNRTAYFGTCRYGLPFASSPGASRSHAGCIEKQ